MCGLILTLACLSYSTKAFAIIRPRFAWPANNLREARLNAFRVGSLSSRTKAGSARRSCWIRFLTATGLLALDQSPPAL